MRLFSFFTLFCCSGIAIIWGFFFSTTLWKSNPVGDVVFEEPAIVEVLRNPFRQSEEAYQRIGKGPLSLHFEPPQLELPDLRDEIFYRGKNERPDVQKELLYLSLKSSDQKKEVEPKSQVYLRYERVGRDLTAKGRYFFSDQPTPLLVQVEESSEQEIELSIKLFDEKGEIVQGPIDDSRLVLRQCEQRGGNQAWEIGGIRVDSSLLFRQKARLVGPDRFFEKHGGQEFADYVGRERIDFMDNSGEYSCFVKEGDFLIWFSDRWVRVGKSEVTQNSPLLVVKRIDEKGINFELWDVDGRSSLTLNLTRLLMHDPLPDVNLDFKLLGAKTWSQFLVECQGKRMMVRLNDWLLLTPEGWKKIERENELEDYVERKTGFPLLVLDKWEKKGGHQCLSGHLFNSLRTEMVDVELSDVLGIQPLVGDLP